MAFSDQWTLSELRTSVRRTLADPSGRFWSDAELNTYINEWQSNLQHHYEFVWNTATVTTSLSTLTLTNIATDIGRVDAVYWNEYRLNARSRQNIEDIVREWRASIAGGVTPKAVYQTDPRTISIWPPQSTAGTLIFEYPISTVLNHDTDRMSIPAWTKYSVRNYVAWKCYLREGPANSPNKAVRYKVRFDNNVKRIRTIWDNYFPSKALRLQPAASYEYDILLARGASSGARTNDMASFTDETPSGTVNGVNAIFTISVNPTQLILTVDGLTVTEGVDYNLSGVTITFISGSIPTTGSVVRAYIYRS